LIHPDDLVDLPDFRHDLVEFGKVIYWKLDLLNRSFDRFRSSGSKQAREDAAAFYSANQAWLGDFALFMALKEFQGGKPWVSWPPLLRDREPAAIGKFTVEHEYAVQRQMYYQYLFFQQWNDLRAYAHQKGIRIIGDIPIFIAHDSADAWSHRDLFYLDSSGQPTVVAGVPPDYFSETGQLWGNPLYRWDVHARDGYSWWMERLRSTFRQVDIARLDHFRGFAGYWEIPAGEETAVKGRWVKGPGEDFLNLVQAEFGNLPIIAEDLGEITPDVIQLRECYHLPGMKILVFAFDSGEQNEFLPHHYDEDCVVYTGTHDNDTAVGWFKRIGEGERSFTQRYLKTSGEDIAWDLIKLGWASKAVFAIAPLQDLLSLDNRARMNYPGKPQGNWGWRYAGSNQYDGIKTKLKEVNYLFGRTTQNG
jgi:4-alpha-glucanotransferase